MAPRFYQLYFKKTHHIYINKNLLFFWSAHSSHFFYRPQQVPIEEARPSILPLSVKRQPCSAELVGPDDLGARASKLPQTQPLWDPDRQGLAKPG